MALVRMRESLCMPARYYQDITNTAPSSIKESLDRVQASGRLTESKNVTVNSLIKILRESSVEESTVSKVVARLKSDGVNLLEHKIYRVPISRINHPERGEYNGNGRGYNSILWHNVMENQQDAWKGLCGLADHPVEDDNPGSFKDSSIVWLGMEVDDINDIVYGIGSFVGPYGHLAQEIIDCGGRVGFSTSGFGELMSDGHTVNPETYQIERLADVVLNPSQEVYGAINDEQKNIEYSGPKEAVAATGNGPLGESYTKPNYTTNTYTYKESNSMDGVKAALSKVEEKELRKHIKKYLNENMEITNPVKQLKDLEEIMGLIQEGKLADLEADVTTRLSETHKKIEEMVEYGLKMKETEVTVTTPDGINITLAGDGAGVAANAAGYTSIDETTPLDGEVALEDGEEETFLESKKIVKGKKLTDAQEKSVRAYVNNFMNESHENQNPLRVYTDLTEVLEVVRESKLSDLEEGVIAKLEETAKQMEKDLSDAVSMKASLGSKDLSEITEKTQGILKSGELLVEQVADYKALCEAMSARNQQLVKEYQALKLKYELLESKEDDSVLARNTKVAELESKLAEAQKKYDELDYSAGSKVAELSESITKYSKGNATLERQNGVISSKLAEATGTLNKMKAMYEAKIEELNTEITRLNNIITAKEADSNKFGESIDNVLVQFNALKESNAALQAEITAMKEAAEKEAAEKCESEKCECENEEKEVKDEKKPETLEEALSFKEDRVEGFWQDLLDKYGEAVEPYEGKIRTAKTYREASQAWMSVMHKVDPSLKTVRETTFYKNGVISQEKRIQKLHENGMLTKQDVKQDVEDINARFLAKGNAFGLL